jgi:molybdopterin molybdotransferase
VVQSLEGALALILQQATPLAPEVVGLEHLVGRVAAESISAPWDMPRWDNSEMDGFAVRAADCQSLSQLRVDGFIPAGSSAAGMRVNPGTAVRIMTGAPVPSGCDAIVPLEDTTHDEDVIRLKKQVQPGDYIRFCGSDIAAGEVMIPAGTVLRPAEINLLAALSCVKMKVHRLPQVAILSTGDELVHPGEMAGPGQISDSNAYSLAAAVRELGAEPLLLGIARDEHTSLKEKIAAGLNADVLISSAGVSTGDRDLVREILEEAGVKELFWKVNIKPGGPTAFGLKEAKLIFSLPGNPVSSMIAFDQLVRPALLKMLGHEKIIRASVSARLKSPLVNETKKLRFIRVRAEATPAGFVAESAGDQNTGVLKTMIQANAIAVLTPECSALAVGEQVWVQLLNPEEFSTIQFHDCQGPGE